MFNFSNKLIEGHSGNNYNNSALANRPLPGKKQCSSCIDKSKNDSSLIKPYYGYNDYKTVGGYAISGIGGLELIDSYKNTDYGYDIPVIIKKNRDQYIVLENEIGNDIDVELYNNDDKWSDLSYISPKIKKEEKMDFVTTFYIGSISIVALFIIYRITQK